MPNEPDKSIRSDILGQLLLIQPTLEIMPNLSGMIEYLSQILLKVPGVAGMQFCYNGELIFHGGMDIPASPECLNCCTTDGSSMEKCGLEDYYGFKKIPWRTLNYIYGYLLLNIDQPASFQPYEPFIKNICNVLAKTIENKEKEENLKKNTRELEYNKNILEAVMDCVADGIVACDKDAMLMLFNKATKEFHGLPVKHIPAEQWADHYDLYLSDGLTPMRKEDVPLFKALKGEDVTNIEMVIAPKNAPRHVLLATGRQLVSKDGDILGAVASMNDITELRKTEKTLRESEKMIYEQSRQLAINELLVNISHHWRQPLQTVSILAQEIRDAYRFNELSCEYLDEIVTTIMKELKMLSNTIDDFRNLYRMEKDKKQFNAADIIRKTLSITSKYFEVNDITVKFQVRDDVTIEGYPDEYSKTISAVLNNAVEVLNKKIVPDKHVEIELYKEPYNGRAILKISDNGGGIKGDIIDKIFDPYFTTKFKESGTGLGLYIAKTLIEKSFNGILSVKNIKNGTEFTIEV